MSMGLFYKSDLTASFKSWNSLSGIVDSLLWNSDNDSSINSSTLFGISFEPSTAITKPSTQLYLANLAKAT